MRCIDGESNNGKNGNDETQRENPGKGEFATDVDVGFER